MTETMITNRAGGFALPVTEPVVREIQKAQVEAAFVEFCAELPDKTEWTPEMRRKYILVIRRIRQVGKVGRCLTNRPPR